MTINPVYTYKNAYGKKEFVSYINKFGIPKEARKKVHLNKMGLCSRRIKSIMIQERKGDGMGMGAGVNDNKKTIEVKNKVCDLNKKIKYDNNQDIKTETRTLFDEPGIPELFSLYLDKYDYNKNTFNSMSAESRRQYERDLRTFYRVFTGNSTMPNTIKKFSDIKLRDFHKKPACREKSKMGAGAGEGVFKKTYDITPQEKEENRALRSYARHVKIMTDNIETQNKRFIQILDQIFVYRIDPETKNKEITLHPTLNMEKLEELIVLTRKGIVELYSGCENDFMRTLQSFETFIESQIQKNTRERIINIKKAQEQLMAEV
jgi:hypothetical protein